MCKLSTFNYSLHSTEREKFSVPTVKIQSDNKTNITNDASNMVNLSTIKLSRRDRRAIERKNKKRR